MPTQRFKIIVKGQPFDVGADSEEQAIQKAMQYYTPTPSLPYEATDPDPSRPDLDGSEGITAEQAAKGIGGLSALVGTAAPFVAAAEAGAPFGPVGWGLAAGVGGGMLANKASEASGLTGLLNRQAEQYRAGMPKYEESDAQHPFIGGTAYNMAGNLANEVSGRGILANSNEALPAVLSLAAGGAAAERAAPAAQGLASLIKGTPKVPVGEEANALLQAVKATHGDFATPPVKRTGELRDVLSTARDVSFGKPVGAAKAAAYDAIKVPKDLGQQVNNAVMGGLVKNGGAKGMMGKFDPQFSKSPEASRDILNTMAQASPKMDSIEKVRAIQEQFASKAGNIRQRLNSTSPGKAVSPEADVYESAAKAMDKYIKSLIPADELGALEAANKPFTGFASIQDIALKSNSKGKFSPEKFKSIWDSQKAAQRAKMDPSGKIEYLVKEGDPNLLEKAVNLLVKGARVALPGPVGRAAKVADRFAPNPVRFNAPIKPNMPQAPMRQSGGLAGLLGQRTQVDAP